MPKRGAAILILLAGGGAALLPPPDAAAEQEWVYTEILSIEQAPSSEGAGGCARLWLEERTWLFRTEGKELAGIYGNNRRTVVLVSDLGNCRFATPPATPLVFSVRTWEAKGTATADGSWEIRAVPLGHPAGPSLEFEHSPFSSRLYPAGNRLIESATTADAADRFVFRHRHEPPAEFGEVVTAMVEGLYSGGCLRIMSETVDDPAALELSAPALALSCDLRRRMAAIAGRVVATTIQQTTIVDRVANQVVPQTPAGPRRLETTYLVEYLVQFERQTVPGTALFTKEDGRWKVVRLWP